MDVQDEASQEMLFAGGSSLTPFKVLRHKCLHAAELPMSANILIADDYEDKAASACNWRRNICRICAKNPYPVFVYLYEITTCSIDGGKG